MFFFATVWKFYSWDIRNYMQVIIITQIYVKKIFHLTKNQKHFLAVHV